MPLHLINSGSAKTQIFKGTYVSSPDSEIALQPCTLPRDCGLVYLIAVGGGGGGGGGQSSASGVTAYGGAGGGSGACCMVVIPRFLLPDIIYMAPGYGGSGGAAGGVGSAGGDTFVYVIPYNDASNGKDTTQRLLWATPGSGGATNGGSGGAAGAATTTIGNMYYSIYSLFNVNPSSISMPGVAGIDTTNGITLLTSSTAHAFCTGGIGGGMSNSSNVITGPGTYSLAGSPNTFNIFKQLLPAAASGNGVDGHGGIEYLFNDAPIKFPINLGGGGGNGNTGSSSTGGNGGNGGAGSGGGGGGGANGTSATGGHGGDGGPGFVIAICI